MNQLGIKKPLYVTGLLKPIGITLEIFQAHPHMKTHYILSKILF